MESKAKKTIKLITKIGTMVLLVFTVFMMVFTIFSVATLDRNDRAIFGTKFYIVQTDSMSKSEKNKDLDVHFNAGDIVLIKNLKDKEKTALKSGDIIAFMSANTDSWGKTITHMIDSPKYNEQTGKLEGYVTYGTNTGAIDEAVVEPDYILGQYKGKIPGIGKFFAFMKTTPGYICCILVPFLLVIIYNATNVIVLFRKYKGEQTAALHEEKAQLEKDREENQRMMAELLALKAQLEGKAPAPTPTAEPVTQAPSEPVTAPAPEVETPPEETTAE